MSKHPSIRHLFVRAGHAARAAAVLGAAATFGGLGLSAAPALAGSCPNEAIREEQGTTRLPECRAYELVTNPFKEGFAPIGNENPLKFIDGVFEYESAGNFAGDAGGTAYNNYIATRSATGWQTVSPNPPSSEYGTAIRSAQGFSPGFRSSLWLMRLPSESTELEDYYIRAPDGTFTRVGPALNPVTAPTQTPGTKGPSAPGPATDAVSEDLSHVVFKEEDYRRLFPPLPVSQYGLYEYVGTGNEAPQPVGVDNAGQYLGQQACSAGMSADGRVVLFIPECNGSQLWASINETTSIKVSASQCTRTPSDPGGACNGPAELTPVGMARDGSRVFFTTTRQLVNGDTDQTNDLYACDIPPGTPAPLGLANSCESLFEVSGPAANANVENIVRVSEDGSRAYFVATGVLAANTDALGERAVSGAHNLYVSHIDAAHPTGQTTFVAKLPSNDTGFHPQTTADGRYLVFTTTSRLLPGDADESADIYRYDADTGSLLRLSTDTSGTGGNTPGRDVTFNPNGMSADGSTVAFQTEEALAPADTNGTRDIYAWHEGQVSLISSGRPSLESPLEEKFAGVSPSGTDIYFAATAQLTPNDGNTAPDIYDARIDGGFSFTQPPRCSGAACQGEQAPQPAAPDAAATAAFNGPGSPTPAEAPPANPPKPRALTRAQKLSKALKACRARPKRKRPACQRHARHTYGSSR